MPLTFAQCIVIAIVKPINEMLCLYSEAVKISRWINKIVASRAFLFSTFKNPNTQKRRLRKGWEAEKKLTPAAANQQDQPPKIGFPNEDYGALPWKKLIKTEKKKKLNFKCTQRLSLTILFGNFVYLSASPWKKFEQTCVF